MNMADWLKAIDYWKAEVASEARAEKLANGSGLGGGLGNKLLVRF